MEMSLFGSPADPRASTRSQSDETPASAEPGARLGSRLLGAELASGGLTRIHALGSCAEPATAARERAYVAKRLQPRFAQDPEAQALLLRSGRALLGVAHPHLAQVLEVHEQPEPYWVMEYVQGVSLDVLLDALPAEDKARFALPVILDALQGLTALHTLRTSTGESRACVHGAPCARHIMVGHDGRGRLVDFTHALGPCLPWSTRRELRLAAWEMAPEQALAPAHVDARCDVFILGRVLWQALTGRGPLQADEHELALHHLLHQDCVAPSAAGSPWGRTLDRISLRALERARSRRYASAAEFASELLAEAPRSIPLAASAEIGVLAQALANAASTSGVQTDLRSRAQPRAATLTHARATLRGMGAVTLREAGPVRAVPPDAHTLRSDPAQRGALVSEVSQIRPGSARWEYGSSPARTPRKRRARGLWVVCGLLLGAALAGVGLGMSQPSPRLAEQANVGLAVQSPAPSMPEPALDTRVLTPEPAASLADRATADRAAALAADKIGSEPAQAATPARPRAVRASKSPLAQPARRVGPLAPVPTLHEAASSPAGGGAASAPDPSQLPDNPY
jgi:hypothetical protein